MTVLNDALPLDLTDLFMRAVVRWRVTVSPESLISLARAEGLPLCAVAPQVGLADHPAWAVAVDDELLRHKKRAITAAAVEAAVAGLAPALAVATPPWRVSVAPALELLVPGWALTEVVARLVAGEFIAAPPGPGGESALLGRLADGVVDIIRLNQAARFLVSGPLALAQLGQAGPESVLRHVMVTAGWAGRARLAELADLLMLARSLPCLTTPEEHAGWEALVTLARELEVALPFSASSADARWGASGPHGSGSGTRTARRTGHRKYDQSPPGLLPLPHRSGDGPAIDLRLRFPGSDPCPLIDTLIEDLAQLGIQAVAETGGPGGIKNGLGSGAVLEVLVQSAGSLARIDPPALPACEPDVIFDDTVGAGRDRMLRAVLLKLAPAKRDQPQSGAWRILLPRTGAGLVLLVDLPRAMADNLRASYPRAVCLARRLSDLSPPGVVWDGRRLPLRPVPADLVVIDSRADTSVAAVTSPGLITAEAQAALVASRRPHTYALYPAPDSLRLITRPGWPVEVSGRRLTRLGHAVATTRAWRLLPRFGLSVVEGTRLGPSTIHQVLLDLGQTIGAQVQLEAILVSWGVPQVNLRVWAGRRQRLGVRVALSACTIRRLEAHRLALAVMQERAFPFLSPTVLATGGYDDVRWLAETWISGVAESGGRAWGARGQGWAAARSVAVAVARECPTGMSGRGWVSSWTEGLGDAICGADQLVAAMGILEEDPIPTAWCHGDLWPGNVLLARRTIGVVDWECARPDSPAGLDLVNVEVFRLAHTRRWSFGWAAAWLAGGGASMLDREPALGWTSLAPRHRRALVAAVVANHLIRGSRPDLTRAWAEANLSPFLATLPS